MRLPPVSKEYALASPLASLITAPLFGWVAPLLLLGLLGAFSEFLWHEHILRKQSETRQEALRSASTIRALLESELNATAYLANGIESYIVGTNGQIRPQEIEPMLALLFGRSPHFRNLGIAPGNRLSYIYPLKGNESALGLYYPDNADQWPAIEETIREQKARLAGPVRLVQGGNALIFRLPVFVNDRYWGIISTVIDAESLLAQLLPFTHSHPEHIALRDIDRQGKPGKTFFGNARLFEESDLILDISIPGGSWQLAMNQASTGTADYSLRILGWLASASIALLGALLLASIRRISGYGQAQAQMVERLREAERSLARHRDRLEEEVVERTAALQEACAALVIARDDAEAANRAKSAFLTNTSHELRTPLHGIRGLTHILLRKSPRPEQIECMEKIQASAQRLLQLVDNLLNLSSMESGQLQLSHTVFQSSQLAAQIQENFIREANDKGLALEIDLSKLPAMIKGDIEHVQRLLHTLIGNAIKFTEVGCINLSAAVEYEDKHGLTARFSVSDTGIGINAEDIERLFRPFEQGDNSVTRKFGGSGLGLAIARELARLMGGDCGVSSKPGQGSVFWFTARFGKVS